MTRKGTRSAVINTILFNFGEEHFPYSHIGIDHTKCWSERHKKTDSFKSTKLTFSFIEEEEENNLIYLVYPFIPTQYFNA